MFKEYNEREEQELEDVINRRSLEFGKWLNNNCTLGRGLPMDSWIHFELGKINTKEAYRYFCELNDY